MRKPLIIIIAIIGGASFIAFAVVERMHVSQNTWMACFWAWLSVVGITGLSIKLRQAANPNIAFAYPTALRLVLLPLLIALIAWLYRPEIVPFGAVIVIMVVLLLIAEVGLIFHNLRP
ncbi:MAG: hypothetical protein NZ580_02715 [Bacteroidia bacterium]|nr:hypothetical protein [Bacteroidia bacterium]MDW8235699.1 hypothetical protein [Bacteroidia bacterium]